MDVWVLSIHVQTGLPNSFANVFSDESGGEQAEKFSHAAVQRLCPDLIADRAAALFRIRR